MTPTLNTILYVEDEPDIRTVAQLALETVGGFTLRVCGSGEEAVEIGPAFKPDLILLDVMMPGMDGPDYAGISAQGPFHAGYPGDIHDGQGPAQRDPAIPRSGSTGCHRQTFRPDDAGRAGAEHLGASL